MPIPFSSVLGLVSAYTPTSGASGVGIQVADAFERQKNNRLDNRRADAYLDLQQDEFSSKSQRLATDDRRKLLDALQASVRSGDTMAAKAIRSELKRIGIGVDLPDENVTALPNSDGEPQLEAPAEDPGAGAPSWLTDELGKRNELPGQSAPEGPPGWLTDALGQRNELPDTTPVSPVLSAMARTQTPEAPSAPSDETLAAGAPASAAKRRFRAYDLKTGEDLFSGEWGPQGDPAGDVRAVYGPIIEGARTPDEANLAQAAQGVAEKLTEVMSPDKAIELAEKYRTGELDRVSKEARGGHGGPGGAAVGRVAAGGMSPQDGTPGQRRTNQAVDLDMAKFVRDERDRIGRQYGVSMAQKALNDSSRLIAMAKSGRPLGEIIAVAQNIKQQFGAAASEGEREFVRGAEPWLDRLMLKLTALGTNSASRIADDMLSDIVSVAEMTRGAAREQIDRASQDLEYSLTEGNPHFNAQLEMPGEREAVRRAARGAYGRNADARTGANAPSGEKPTGVGFAYPPE